MLSLKVGSVYKIVWLDSAQTDSGWHSRKDLKRFSNLDTKNITWGCCESIQKKNGEKFYRIIQTSNGEITPTNETYVSGIVDIPEKAIISCDILLLEQRIFTSENVLLVLIFSVTMLLLF